MSQYRELLLGCGRSRDKRLDPGGTIRPWQALTTLDNNEDVGPDVLFNLDSSTKWPFEENSFDEVHAYEVLEHVGRQGNARAFFHHFFQIWRLLKPGGFLCATCPSRFSEWLWGDPGHSRAILPASLNFLSQPYYAQCDGAHPTECSDYRSIWSGDYDLIRTYDDHTHHKFILQAVKPARKPPYAS